MVVYSFYRKGLELEPVEIEVTLLPGIPAFHVTGLPDAATKESVMRIKAALRHQGFELPTHQQVLFHLRPTHERKSSQGLDLALAAAYLWKTEQLPPATFDGRLFLYGELTLDGEVQMPDELHLLEALPARDGLITGPGDLAHCRGVVRELSDLSSIVWQEGEFTAPEFEVDHQMDHLQFCAEAARCMTVAATGEHNLFLAGPAGSGKTTFARALHTCLRNPTPAEWRRIEKVERISKPSTSVFAENSGRVRCRPLVAPHHSATEIAILGGGVPPQSGEITRAHHGLLLLDEFLNYESRVVECLREPIERHEITLMRGGTKTTFPADFMLVATTNLCPCGDHIPNSGNTCQRSLAHCRSYYDRLSGPMVDRFDMVAFTHRWSAGAKVADAVPGPPVTVGEVRARVAEAQEFARESRGQTAMNSRLPLEAAESMVPDFVREHLLPELPPSHRRRLALFRVARTVADLARSPKVKASHLDAAAKLTLQPFKDFRQSFR